MRVLDIAPVEMCSALCGQIRETNRHDCGKADFHSIQNILKCKQSSGFENSSVATTYISKERQLSI